MYQQGFSPKFTVRINTLPPKKGALFRLFLHGSAKLADQIHFPKYYGQPSGDAMVTWKTSARVENVRFHPLRFLLWLEVIDTEQKLEIFLPVLRASTWVAVDT